MKTTKETFLIDRNGHKKAVVLDINFYNQLMEDFEDIRIIAERKNQPCIPLEKAEKKLKRNGLI
ncbi:MAG: hypothetical protein AB1633_00655 [Elusimicrobiota bacterium]